jgi:hypothetical protein
VTAPGRDLPPTGRPAARREQRRVCEETTEGDFEIGILAHGLEDQYDDGDTGLMVDVGR